MNEEFVETVENIGDAVETASESGVNGLVLAGAVGVGVVLTLAIQKGLAWFKTRKGANDYVVEMGKKQEDNDVSEEDNDNDQ